MRPKTGLYVRDANLNLYRIIDERSENTHTPGSDSFLVECLQGPNTGTVRWVMKKTIESGDFHIVGPDNE